MKRRNCHFDMNLIWWRVHNITFHTNFLFINYIVCYLYIIHIVFLQGLQRIYKFGMGIITREWQFMSLSMKIHQCAFCGKKSKFANPCHFCERPVCPNEAHYIPARDETVRGIRMKVLRVCPSCKPSKSIWPLNSRTD